jgi:hypothetical protein
MYVGVNNLKKDIEDGVHLVLAQAGEKWVNYLEQYSDEVEQLIKLTRNKRRFDRQGMRAATLIRSISIASLSPPKILIENRKSHGAWGGFTSEFCRAPIIFRTDASELKKLGFSLLVKGRDAVFE